MNKKNGYIRVCAIVPELEVGNTDFNSKEIIKLIKSVDKKGAQIALFPELSITGYTCGDLFYQDCLLDNSLKALKNILNETKNLDLISIIGLPLRIDNQLFNVAAIIQKGNILGIVPKTYVPNYNEFYEKRWFSSSFNILRNEIIIFGKKVYFGNNLIFEDELLKFGVEICEDVWVVNSPSNYLTLNGALAIFNLSASNEIIGKYEFRKNLINIQSAKNICAYIYSSSGVNESTSDLVFSGHSIICENGSVLNENNRYDFKSNIIINDIDIKKLINDRVKNKNFIDIYNKEKFIYIPIEINDKNNTLLRKYSKYPFVPSDKLKINYRCEEILNIQACGLCKRLKHTNIKKCVIGISGGLDSTLSLLVIIKAFKILGISNENIIAITMPGFGTTNRTYENAKNLIKNYNCTFREINISESVLKHFKDIEVDEKIHDITYENAQARERTQILMDVANKENALVIGTGDLSELALGWCTYNGDHMSMYATNTSIPKTLVRYLVEYVKDNENGKIKKVLSDILDTPISPELLPPDEYGKIKQKTENVIGPYVLHDFFLYHFLRYGASPDKIFYIACQTFTEFDKKSIKKWLTIFINRFFSQQFKRNCMPDGVKVGTINLSPRGDLRMPSDANNDIWIKTLNEIKDE